MNYAYLFGGIAIGMFFPWIVMFIVLRRKNEQTAEQLERASIPNKLLEERNQIGIRQCKALEAIAGVINAGSDEPKKPDTLQMLKTELSVIRTVAAPPHHPNALQAIRDIASKALTIVEGREA